MRDRLDAAPPASSAQDSATSPRPPPGEAGDVRRRARPAQYALKRAVEYGTALAGLTAGAPLLVAIALAIRIDSPGSPIFRQERVGLAGRSFELLKFRTMTVDAGVTFNEDGSTRVDQHDARVTRIGRHLRGALDELPQLVNVLRGEVALVGPRPDMPVHAELYTAEEWRKLSVLPGITSLAAVLGRNELPWKQRIAIDLRYIDRWSLGLDLRILLQTLCLPLGVRIFTFADVIDD